MKLECTQPRFTFSSESEEHELRFIDAEERRSLDSASASQRRRRA